VPEPFLVIDPEPVMIPDKGLRRRTAINKNPTDADITGEGAATQCSGSANLQRAGADGRRAGVGVVGVEQQRAGASLDQGG